MKLLDDAMPYALLLTAIELLFLLVLALDIFVTIL